MLKIRRVLISVWDKKGVVDFAKKLSEHNVEIISTGKTASLLRKSGVNAQDVSSLTLFPEILSGRVKTLHPKVFGGILANKKHPLHMEEIKNLSIQPIDMVIVNLYPFVQKVNDKLIWDEMVEYIDIGGPSMLRAAAKNFKNVACVSDCSQYKAIADELKKSKGFLSENTLKALAQQVFYLTREYDNCIYNYFKGQEILTWNLEKSSSLRYGENPHQSAGLYDLVDGSSLKVNQIQGKELSYNNFLDLDAAYTCIREFDEPAATIVKHASICGVGVDKKLASAYKKAYLTDTLSSFGGIIALNRKVDKETADQIIKSGFKECVIAPSYSKEALKMFSTKKNLRVLETSFNQKISLRDIRATAFGHLVQEKDAVSLSKNNLRVVTKKKPSPHQLKDLVFAWKVVKYVRSNAIVVAKNQSVLGIGGGQPSRVGAAKIALAKLAGSCKGAVLASDGFFPKEDSIKLVHKKGVRAIIQPGGSIKDNDIIDLCNKLGIVMIFVGMRHFRH
ncbi:MAG: bifunctional phosphoribosylaminoimidazolecarboxamide formyltransferase/IMP cyclohydrolase [Candidatus Omnitrophica bacterium]|nr:bifunctional phosphoribosylaminoimidazolecarboxamide formyltransferase/IMP cyclohydrolase [Candidatus Omnitrophota bacterium]